MAARRNLTISVIRLAGETNSAAALRRYAVHPSRPLAESTEGMQVAGQAKDERRRKETVGPWSR